MSATVSSLSSDQRAFPPGGKAAASKAWVVVVEEDQAGQRLDNFVARLLPAAPKSYVFRIIRSGEVRVSGARSAPDYRILIGDSLRLPPQAQALREPAAPKALAGSLQFQTVQGKHNAEKIATVFEDEWLWAVDKPQGMAVHGGSGVSLGVIESLRLARPELPFLELVHRLDKETSGLLLLAKKRQALVALQAQFRLRHPNKSYLAWVLGKVPKREKTIRLALSRDAETASGDRRVRVDPQGQTAKSTVLGLTHHQVTHLEQMLSQVQVRIETGRTHQIRVHLSATGFPILGDPKYGDFQLNKQFAGVGAKRMYLHAWKMSLRHPMSNSMLDLEAPVNAAFNQPASL